MRYFLGIDGGGSGTRAVVLSDVLEVLGHGEAGPSNHYAVGPEGAADACYSAAQDALDAARRIEPELSNDKISAWGFGLAGVRRESDAAKVRERLVLRVRSPFVLDHDAAAAQSGAFGGDAGIVLSAGTGAICFGVDEHGERFFADGWGSVMGDEGSGYWIGQQALKAICRAADGRGPKTRLSAPILDALCCRDEDEMVQKVYGPDWTRDAMARLASLVFDAAQSGSREACTIRDAAASRLGNAIIAVTCSMLRRARERAEPNQPEAREIAVALRGGLFEDDHFRAAVGYVAGERFVELKRDYWPISSWKIVKPQYEAAVGAALLAQRNFR
ncbi:MAG TPA: BadF/BadG/BcrA/BcrD ATPase family protein [Abditibacteriaceae bacterium]|jgi:N-acetylglucosamine kinase-like BadF-type ATPase